LIYSVRMDAHKGRNAREFTPLMWAVFHEFLFTAKGLGVARTDVQRAEAVGMSYPTYRRFKRGTHHLDVDELTRIARFMQITPGELITNALKRVADESQP